MSVSDIQKFMVVFGLVSSAFDLMTFGLLLWVFRAGEARFQTSWFVLSLLTELAVLLILRTRGPALASRPGRVLVLVTAAVALIAVASSYLGAFSRLFGLQPLPPGLLGLLVLMALAYALTSELVKRCVFRSSAHGAAGARRPRPRRAAAAP